MKKWKIGEIYLRPVSGKAKIFASVLLASAILLTALYAKEYYIDSQKVHTASDFGFEDKKSALDFDGDGIDDYTDILEGARAYIATNPYYKSAYFAGGYPTDGTGVCTDVVWNALKAAGYCLKDMVDADIASNREEYEKYGTVGDPNIDFRRVRNLLVFFKRYSEELTLSLKKPEEWMPGDIVIFDGHIGICSDRRNYKGIPYVIHHPSVAVGAVEEDFIGTIKLVGHFRLKETGLTFNEQ